MNDLDLKTAIELGGIFLGVGMSWGIAQVQISNLRETVKKLETDMSRMNDQAALLKDDLKKQLEDIKLTMVEVKTELRALRGENKHN